MMARLARRSRVERSLSDISWETLRCFGLTIFIVFVAMTQNDERAHHSYTAVTSLGFDDGVVARPVDLWNVFRRVIEHGLLHPSDDGFFRFTNAKFMRPPRLRQFRSKLEVVCVQPVAGLNCLSVISRGAFDRDSYSPGWWSANVSLPGNSSNETSTEWMYTEDGEFPSISGAYFSHVTTQSSSRSFLELFSSPWSSDV